MNVNALTIPLNDAELAALQAIAPDADAGRIATGIIVETLRGLEADDELRAEQLRRWGECA